MKASEIIAQDAVNFDYPSNLEGRVFFNGKITNYMQVILYARSGQRVYQFGLDIIPKESIVLTTHNNKWNYNVMGLLKDLAKDGTFGIGYLIYITDDSEGEAPELSSEEPFFKGISEIEFDI